LYKKGKQGDKDSIERLERYYRHTKYALPVAAGVLLLLIGGLWFIERWISVWIGLKIILYVVAVFSLVGELINFFYLRRKIKVKSQRQT